MHKKINYREGVKVKTTPGRKVKRKKKPLNNIETCLTCQNKKCNGICSKFKS